MQQQNDQLTDKLLKLCNLIEANSQYFTVVRKCITDQQILARDNLPTLQSYLEQKKYKINEESLIQIFIQIAYFVFSCRRYNIKPEIGKQDIRVEQISFKNMPEKKFCPIVYYKINDQRQLEQFQSIKIINDIYNYFFSEYSKYLQSFKNQLTPGDMSFRSFIQKFKKQVDFLLSDTKAYEPNKQKQFFLCLQQTSLFRQYSNLLKIKNSSILDLIKSKQQNSLKFKQCKQKDIELILAYGTQKKKQKADHDKIKQKQREIQSNITNLFKFLSTKANTNTQMSQQQANNFRNEKDQFDKVKISYKYKQKSVNSFYQNVKKILPQLPQSIHEEKQMKKQQPPEMEFLIQYSSQRNTICVRLIPNQVNVHIQNADFLMYQSNILTFQTVNVNIELIQSPVECNGQKKTVKKLAFKGTSCLNQKEPPLQKILLLMDATMIASKICEPELNTLRVVFSGLSDHQRLNLVSSKINHYTRIYLRCAKKVYSQ